LGVAVASRGKPGRVACGRREGREGADARDREEGDRGGERKWKKEKRGKKERRERESGICVDAMRPRPATRDGRACSIAGGISGAVYGWAATRASRGEEDGTSGVRDREIISGFGV